MSFRHWCKSLTLVTFVGILHAVHLRLASSTLALGLWTLRIAPQRDSHMCLCGFPSWCILLLREWHILGVAWSSLSYRACHRKVHSELLSAIGFELLSCLRLLASFQVRDMGSIHDSSYVSSITSYCGWILGSARNSTETASARSVSLVKASFANALAFTFMLHGMTSMEAVENKLNCSFALSR